MLFSVKVYRSLKCEMMNKNGQCVKGIFCAFLHIDGEPRILLLHGFSNFLEKLIQLKASFLAFRNQSCLLDDTTVEL